MPAPTFRCETAAESLGFAGATVRMCQPETVLSDLVRVVLDGTPKGRYDAVLYVPGGVISSERGGEAMARYLRGSGMWAQPSIAAQEIRSALLAFSAYPAGFDVQSGPRTVDASGAAARVALPEFTVVLETTATAYRKSGGSLGASRPDTKVRATLRGGPSAPLTWTIEQSDGGVWSPLSTIALEP